MSFSLWAGPKSQYLTEDKKNSVLKDERKAVREYMLWEVYRCSMTVVSNSCYALTSGHCLEYFLDINKHVEHQTIPDGDDTHLVMVDSKKLKGLKLPIEVNKKKMDAKFVAMGTGLGPTIRIDDLHAFTPTSEGEQPAPLQDYKEFNKYIKETHYGPLGDWALIKLPEQNCSCLPTGKETPNGNVMMTGYPDNDIHTIETKKINPDIETPISVAEGVVCVPDKSNRIAQINKLPTLNRIFSKVLHSAEIGVREKVLKQTAEDFKEELIFHSARSGNGASGGALVNSRHELVGINQGGTNFDKETDPFSIAVSVDYIKKEAQKKMSPEEFKEAFTCDPKK